MNINDFICGSKISRDYRKKFPIIKVNYKIFHRRKILEKYLTRKKNRRKPSLKTKTYQTVTNSRSERKSILNLKNLALL